MYFFFHSILFISINYLIGEIMEKQVFEYLGATWEIDYQMEDSYESIIKKVYPNIQWNFSKYGDYQGEWFCFGQDSDGFWFCQGSFGSCSGCDLIEGVNTIEEAKEAINTVSRKAFIGKTKAEAIQYIRNEQKNLVTYDVTLEDLIQQLQSFPTDGIVCKKCGKAMVKDIEGYMISSIIMKENNDYERTADVECLCEDCYNKL